MKFKKLYHVLSAQTEHVWKFSHSEPVECSEAEAKEQNALFEKTGVKYQPILPADVAGTNELVGVAGTNAPVGDSSVEEIEVNSPALNKLALFLETEFDDDIEKGALVVDEAIRLLLGLKKYAGEAQANINKLRADNGVLNQQIEADQKTITDLQTEAAGFKQQYEADAKAIADLQAEIATLKTPAA